MISRSAGILLPIFSLPGEYGVGTLGREARAFVDFLAAAKQTWWQILPLCPTMGGDSPYSADSTFAGNPLFIDPELLKKDGLVTEAELAAIRRDETGFCDYAAVRPEREALLKRAFSRIDAATAAKARAFAAENPWVRPWALYRALKRHFGGAPWFVWPEDIRRRSAGAVEHYTGLLAEDIACEICVQYWFDQQFTALRAYAREKGVKILGDLPIYVSLDSADVWSEPEQFLLDSDFRPAKVSGVPPDYFSAEGQLWGNPLYNWPAMERDGYGWWIRRIGGLAKYCDAIRIDHFRALAAYWAVPASSPTARDGAWEKGPGLDFLRRMTGWFHETDFLAEDLGILTPDVHALRDAAGLPGMKVLEFAFDGPANEYLPHHHVPLCACYVGTHDNQTAAGWAKAICEPELSFAKAYLGVKTRKALPDAVLKLGMSSCANLFVAQMQDWLGLDDAARINTPGTSEGNWRWRMRSGALTDALAEKIRSLTALYDR